VTHSVAIIGCGLIGQKRAEALRGAKVVACGDVLRDRAEALARATGAVASGDWREIVKRDEVSIVIVATTNNHQSVAYNITPQPSQISVTPVFDMMLRRCRGSMVSQLPHELPRSGKTAWTRFFERMRS